MELKFVTTAEAGNADAHRTGPLKWKAATRTMRWMIGYILAGQLSSEESCLRIRVAFQDCPFRKIAGKRKTSLAISKCLDRT